ncbi:MAG: glucose-6-phosphate isomerase [Pelagibacterales bacterium]|nr:glucose-6-phosphate isomerase [Pelagibacterales bacterium]
MLKEDAFFKNYFNNSKKYNSNFKKTKKIFNSLLIDFRNNKVPLLESCEKNYNFSFSKKTVKKFSKYQNIIVIGMGGSILGTKSIYSFLKKKVKKKVFFFDNLDLDLQIRYREIKNLKNSCFIIAGKSGRTIETIINLGTIFSKKLFKNKLIIIAQPTDNALIDIAQKYNAEIIEHKEYISGRYSVLSETGMFPAALMGLNLKKFKNLKKFIKNKNFVSTLIKNVASIHTLNSKKINNSIILNYNYHFNDLGYWYQQLVAESLGKKGKGINPILSFGPKDHHSLLQLYLDGPKDKFFTFFNTSQKQDKFKVFQDIIPHDMRFLKNKSLSFVVNAQSSALKKIFKLKKIPFREITFKKGNEEELGKIFIFFILETILLARLMNINPFDQPAVEQVKNETKKILK